MWVSVLVLVAAVSPASATDYTFFPDDGWEPLECGTQPMTDAFDDRRNARDALDLVGDDDAPAGYLALGDVGLFVRMRLDEDPNPGGVLDGDRWYVQFDTDGAIDTFEAVVELDGTDEEITLSVPGEATPREVWPLGNRLRTVPTSDSSFGGDVDAFLDVRIDADALDQLGISFQQYGVIRLATAPGPGTAINGDTVCQVGPRQGPDPDDTGGAILEGGGGCSHVPSPSPSPSPLLLVFLGVVGVRRRHYRCALPS